MSAAEILEKTGTDAVFRLRKNKLAAGKPFMINLKDLPSKQCYLEYSNGTINLVTIAPNDRSFLIIRKLSYEEAQSIRNKFNLSPIKPPIR